MKKLMKLISVILCMVLLSTTAFAAGSDAQTVYEAAAKKMDTVTSMQVSGTMKVNLSGSDMVYNYTLKQRINEQGKLEMEMTVMPELYETTATAHYKDGYLYTNMYDKKTKVKMSEKDAMVTMTTPGKDWFNSSEVEQVSGGERIKAKISTKQLQDLMGGMLLAGADSFLASHGYFELFPANTATVFTVGDSGYLKSQKLAYTLTMGTMKTKYTINMKFSSLNKVESISFPSDLDAYKTASK